MSSKLIDLADAAALVPDGATISFGGFTVQRHPMAFVYELIRLRRLGHPARESRPRAHLSALIMPSELHV